MITLKPASEAVQKPTLPTPTVSADLSEDGKSLIVTTVFPMDYPEEAIQKRLGKVPKDEKGNPTGEERPVTSVTYGKGRKLSLGFADPNDNLMLLNIQLFAQTPEAEAESGEGEGES